MRRPPGTRANYVHFCQHSTRWGDNDTYGHMNNVVHYLLFDTTVNKWLISNGLLNIKTSPEIGLVVETGCRYLQEMSFPQVITAGLRVASIGTSSVRYEIGLFPDDSELAAAEGFFVHVYVDAESRRPCGIPVKTRVALAGLINNTK
ncbi:acyl-CoA thioesterase [Tabrizicola sp. BL-A-41-H6]|uniref:acyl-CoA thioesterase n=1 Tax=Tabrizicola sp. BL-A-41-H6 TaxID=3421107 RepID=UPI003D66986B